jgi:hypothetical protein
VRFICGTQKIHKDLETAVTRFLGTEDTIIYSSCFDANGGLFETLLGPEDAVVPSYPAPIAIAPLPTPPAGLQVPAVTGELEIKSPMIGTFYRAPSPESATYVEVGTDVNPETVVCIIEAMKVMNEIKADITAARDMRDKLSDIAVQTGVELRVVAGRLLGDPPSEAFRNVALWLCAGGENVFLQDANTLIMKTPDLVRVVSFLKQSFPELNRITSYARAKTLKRKGVEELKYIDVEKSFNKTTTLWLDENDLFELTPAENVIWAILVDAKTNAQSTSVTAHVDVYGTTG